MIYNLVGIRFFFGMDKVFILSKEGSEDIYRKSLTPIADTVFHPVTQGVVLASALVFGAYDITHKDTEDRAVENEQETIEMFTHSLASLEISARALQSQNDQFYDSAVNTLLHNSSDENAQKIQPETIDQRLKHWTSAVLLSSSLSEDSKETLLDEFNENIDRGEDIHVAAAFLDECRIEQTDASVQAASNNKMNANALADDIAQCSLKADQAYSDQSFFANPEEVPLLFVMLSAWFIGLYGLFGGRGLRNAVAHKELEIGNKIYNWKQDRQYKAHIKNAKH